MLSEEYGKSVVIYNIHGSNYQEAGIPDLLICYKGLFIALELKTDIGAVSQIQQYQLSRLSGAGATAKVVRTVEEVKKIFENL
jgi:hypothetical protein